MGLHRRAVFGAMLAAPGLARAVTLDRVARQLVGFPPGGASDIVPHLLAERLTVED